MADAQRPESWVGREVMLARARATQAELVRLESLNEQGVLCTYLEAEIEEPVLIPWDAVSWVRLAVREEVGETEGGYWPPRRAASSE